MILEGMCGLIGWGDIKVRSMEDALRVMRYFDRVGMDSMLKIMPFKRFWTHCTRSGLQYRNG